MVTRILVIAMLLLSGCASREVPICKCSNSASEFEISRYYNPPKSMLILDLNKPKE